MIGLRSALNLLVLLALLGVASVASAEPAVACAPEEQESRGRCCPAGASWAPEQCPRGWRWGERACQCRNPCPASPWQLEHAGVRFVVETADAQSECEDLWRRAESLSEAGDRGEAAEVFLAIYRDHRDHCQDIAGHCMDEVLSRAADGYRAAGRLDASIQVWRRLIQDYGDGGLAGPASGDPLAARAMLELGRSYRSMALYAQAAEFFEDYARIFPSASGVAVALQEATELRLALGHHEEAARSAALFEERFGRSREHAAASTDLALALGRDASRRRDWPMAVERLRAFLSERGAQATADQQILARVGLGEALLASGSQRARGEARASLVLALRLAGPTPAAEEERRQGPLREALARASFLLGEEARGELGASEAPTFHQERALRHEVRTWWSHQSTREAFSTWESVLRVVPPGLRARRLAVVQYRFWVERRLRPWLERVEASLEDAARHYRAASAEGVPRWEVAAAAQTAGMHREVDAALSAVPVLDEAGAGAWVTAAAGRHRALAITDFQRGLALALARRWSGRWSRRCEVGLHELDPGRYPLNDEISAPPELASSPLALPDLVARRQPPLADAFDEE